MTLKSLHETGRWCEARIVTLDQGCVVQVRYALQGGAMDVDGGWPVFGWGGVRLAVKAGDARLVRVF